MGKSSERLIAILAVTVTAVLWGTTGTAATFAPEVGPLAIGAAALGIGGLLQAAIAAGDLQRAQTRLRMPGNSRVLFLGAASVCVYPLAFYSSMHFAGVAVGSTVSLASAPIFSGLLERLLTGTRLNVRWLWAASLGIVGSACLCLAKAQGTFTEIWTVLIGIALGFVAGASYAFYAWAAARLIGNGIPRAAAMGAVFGLGGALLMPVLIVTGAPLVSSWNNFAVGAYMALVPMFAGYVLFGYGLARINASTATTITLLEPAVATILAVLVVGEVLSPLGWFGVLLLGVAMLLLVWGPDSSSAPPGGSAASPANGSA